DMHTGHPGGARLHRAQVACSIPPSRSAVRRRCFDAGREIPRDTDAGAIAQLQFRFPVFLGGPSIDAHHVRQLLFVLEELKPRVILELGSGTSTVIVARALQALGYPPEMHIAVDHDARYLRNTIQLARVNGVEQFVRFEHCPLAPVPGYTLPWYSDVPDRIGRAQIDLVIVDGPPAYEPGKERSREPALPVIRSFLSERAVVILDDANREAEGRILERWLQDYPEFSLTRVREGKGVAILTLREQR
ncbi:MAG: class I SAM-dependent methyltransferase, partial [Candidatus Rokuibacteriota bacterium]